MDDERITLCPNEHPAVSFVAAQRVQAALGEQPRRTAVTAARLVGEIIDQLTREHDLRALHLDVNPKPGAVEIAISGFVTAAGSTSTVDGLARLLLNRLAATWGEDPTVPRIWFVLVARRRPTFVRAPDGHDQATTGTRA